MDSSLNRDGVTAMPTTDPTGRVIPFERVRSRKTFLVMDVSKDQRRDSKLHSDSDELEPMPLILLDFLR